MKGTLNYAIKNNDKTKDKWNIKINNRKKMMVNNRNLKQMNHLRQIIPYKNMNHPKQMNP